MTVRLVEFDGAALIAAWTVLKFPEPSAATTRSAFGSDAQEENNATAAIANKRAGFMSTSETRRHGFRDGAARKRSRQFVDFDQTSAAGGIGAGELSGVEAVGEIHHDRRVGTARAEGKRHR